jgi:Fe-S-cluster containining protein
MGTCSQCGQCCKILVFNVPHKHMPSDEKRYYDYHNVKIERVNRNTDRYIVYAPCIHLTKDNKCDIFDTRPDICDYKNCKIKFYRPDCCTDR